MLDSPPQEAFDRLTRLVTRILDVPVALVTLVDRDRQFFTSCIGLPEPWNSTRETPLSHSFCQYTVQTAEPLIISDAREHPELRENLAIRDLGVIAYAGIPLITTDGHVLGTFCAIDTKPRHWVDADIETLRDLAGSATSEIELHRALTAERRLAAEARRAGEDLRLLAESGRILSLSLDLDTTLRAVAELALPVLADIAMVDIVEDGVIRRVAASHAEPRFAEATERARMHPPRLDEPGLQAEVIRSGKAILVSVVDEGWIHSAARNPEHAEIIRGMGVGSVAIVPLRSRGKVLGALSLIRGKTRPAFDVHDCNLAEELGRRAASAVDNARVYESSRRATDARDDMLGVVSHDLRNPVHTIFMSSSFLLDLLPETMELERNQARIIKRSAERANRLIQDLLDITRIENGQLSLDLRTHTAAALVDEAIELSRILAAEKGILFERGTVDESLTVSADRDRILQALGNLIGNSIKFAPTGGRITVSAVRSGMTARFSVTDTGPGISEEHRPRLFDRFWQAKRADKRGVGLGLSIVKGIADAHQGTVDVQTEIGKGSTFTLAIPAAP